MRDDRWDEAPRSHDLEPRERASVRQMYRPLLWLLGLGILFSSTFFMWFMGWYNTLNYLYFLLVLAALAVYAPILVLRSVRKAARRIRRLYVPQGMALRDPASVAELTESRREIVAAFEIERRRIERDLHDGAQQYLVRAVRVCGSRRYFARNGGLPFIAQAAVG